MTAENEYITKDNKKETKQSAAPKKKATRKRASKKKTSPLAMIRDRFDKKKLKSSIGVSLLLLSFFLFLANFSYLLTWKVDQNRVINTGFFEFIFDGNEEPVA
ncbi:MAG: DNA translocase FtsK, partial [Crocinitomicaceae bacterium]|nr:DNA translocase FtsK [Crocinitomicaceae bacterium]